ncbi:MAG: hypothetical protein MJ191_06850 [Clostridium sp.]|nr:hypothetical protein [Clostridium sp.]
MKVKKIINLDKTYKAKNGKDYPVVNYYLVLDNNKYVPIRPAFGDDYATLDAVAEVTKNGGLNEVQK